MLLTRILLCILFMNINMNVSNSLSIFMHSKMITKRYLHDIKNPIEIASLIGDITSRNIGYIDKLELSIKNPKKLNLFHKNIYEATLWFDKNDMRVVKRFENNYINILFNDINYFINREIKI